jgi:hypothetical protein
MGTSSQEFVPPENSGRFTAAFWAALGKVMPDYEARREALRGMGARLEW